MVVCLSNYLFTEFLSNKQMNEFQSLIIIILLGVGTMIVWWVSKKWSLKLNAKMGCLYWEPVVRWLNKIDWKLVMLSGIYLGVYIQDIDVKGLKEFVYLLGLWWMYYVIILGFDYVDLIFKFWGKKIETGKQPIFDLLRVITKIGLVTVGSLFVLSNLGLDVSSLLTGIGIGGIAIALAVQNILGDLFSALAILLDQPFIVGDFIVAGEYRGKVEKIGIKTTRIRSLKGEEIVIPNKELTASVIQNFRRMEKRRVAFEVGVEYETPVTKLREIPAIIEGVLSGLENVFFKRASLIKMTDYALVFEVVYELVPKDYALYVKRQQEIILGLLEAFNKHEIKIAYPTRVVKIKN